MVRKSRNVIREPKDRGSVCGSSMFCPCSATFVLISLTVFGCADSFPDVRVDELLARGVEAPVGGVDIHQICDGFLRCGVIRAMHDSLWETTAV